MKTEELAKVETRIEPELKLKLIYIAEFNGRSLSKEVRQVLKYHIEDFEKEHGEIKVCEP